LLACLLPRAPIGATNVRDLSVPERRGRQIYLKGESDNGVIKAVLNGDIEVSASAFACINCHGRRGEGTTEGGLKPASINWNTLTTRGTSLLTQQGRGLYDETSLARAITLGVNPNGARLHPAMPRYRMTREQLADLIAYLKCLGDELDADQGLSEDTIKVGAVLPLTGPLATVGEDVKQTLNAYFSEMNESGGIYGRKFELVTADSRSEAAESDKATHQLVEKNGVFALVGSFETGTSEATNEYLRKNEVPLVAPVILSPLLPQVPNRFVFYLLPSFNDQARSLVDFIAIAKSQSQEPKAIRLAVLYSGNGFDLDALTGVKTQAKARSMQIVAEQNYETGKLSATSVVEALVVKKPDYIFYFGNGEDFSSLAREMERVKLEANLLTCATMVGRSAFSLPAVIASRTYLSYSTSLPDKDDFAEFVGLMQKAVVQLRSPAFQAIAYAGAKTFVEGVKASGRQLNRVALIDSLERLQDFRTGVLPPITFGPNRRIGVSGSYIVGIDVDKKRYVPLGSRMVPLDNDR
jgi:ABC-type branched-subunit amino acid transport system substrate-binding protein